MQPDVDTMYTMYRIQCIYLGKYRVNWNEYGRNLALQKAIQDKNTISKHHIVKQCKQQYTCRQYTDNT